MKGCVFVPNSDKKKVRLNSRAASSPMTSVGAVDDEDGQQKAFPHHERPRENKNAAGADVKLVRKTLMFRVDRQLFKLDINLRMRSVLAEDIRARSC